MVPQRFFVHGQSAQGDRHVYAARTRFIPESLVRLFERSNWPVASADSAGGNAGRGARIDIRARMRGMWR
jgi:DNA helicase-2/ATP-dependent DNA helicase PcrA